MDPDHTTSGFHRSIVLQDGLAAANTLAGAAASPLGPDLPPIEPSLAGLGMEFDAPDLASPPTAGATTSFTFRVAASDPTVLPSGVMVGVRWDPLDGSTTSVPGAAPPASPGPAASAPAASPTPAPSPSAAPVDLVSPEVPGAVVAPVAATVTAAGISVPVRVPAKAGLYRLVGTIHGSDGVAYDAATQALVPALIVRVTGALAARYEAPASAFATAGGPVELTVRVTNLGASAWGAAAVDHHVGSAEVEPASRATLVARWVNLSMYAAGAPAPERTSVLPAGFGPGATASVDFSLVAPDEAGDYLLLLDVINPGSGSLAIAGVPPGIVRVVVSGSSGTAAP